MIVQTPHPFTLTIEACATEAHHFRWEIRRGMRLVTSSSLSYPAHKDATAEGYAALRRVIADWRGERTTGSRQGRAPHDATSEDRASAS